MVKPGGRKQQNSLTATAGKYKKYWGKPPVFKTAFLGAYGLVEPKIFLPRKVIKSVKKI